MQFQSVRFGVDRVRPHGYGYVNGGAIDRPGDSHVRVGAERTVRVCAAGEHEGYGVGPAVGDGPEQDVHGGGGGEEVFGKEGVESVVDAGER